MNSEKGEIVDYRAAGVDIAAAERALDEVKGLIQQTFTSEVLRDVGLFGGFFDARFPAYRHPVLVASTDGVGTKLLIAIYSGIHHTIGEDLVNHCVNDILSCGARPLFFLDYFATGKLEEAVVVEVLRGIARACREHHCALLGGETAEMPSMYAEGHYDLAGTIVGIVEKERILDGSTIVAGDLLVGLRSSGLHTNGYSLARAVLLKHYRLDQVVPELGETLAEALLTVHRSYYHLIAPLLERGWIKGIAHVTGGGILGNVQRILPKGLSAEIRWGSWEIPPIFTLIQRLGAVSDEEMRRVFNLGIGMLLVVAPEHVEKVLQQLPEPAVIVGEIRATA